MQCTAFTLCITLGQYLSDSFEQELKQTGPIHNSEEASNIGAPQTATWSAEMDPIDPEA